MIDCCRPAHSLFSRGYFEFGLRIPEERYAVINSVLYTNKYIGTVDNNNYYFFNKKDDLTILYLEKHYLNNIMTAVFKDKKLLISLEDIIGTQAYLLQNCPKLTCIGLENEKLTEEFIFSVDTTLKAKYKDIYYDVYFYLTS